jgi:hypothetical protein
MELVTQANYYWRESSNIERINIFTNTVRRMVKTVETINFSATNAENHDSETLEAARLLCNDYVTDKELIAFTSLDSEGFYEEG